MDPYFAIKVNVNGMFICGYIITVTLKQPLYVSTHAVIPLHPETIIDQSLGHDTTIKIVDLNQGVPKNEFHFIAATYNTESGLHRLFVDGYLRASKNIGKVTNIGTIGNVLVGSCYGRYLNAKIKGIQVYDRALTNKEITRIMQWDKPPIYNYH